VLRTAMFFSLMSAFNIGFRDINFGRWLRLLTRREYDLKAVGWARTVSGLQSLLSVYLIALWVLSLVISAGRLGSKLLRAASADRPSAADRLSAVVRLASLP
jgi:hypothetical protein